MAIISLQLKTKNFFSKVHTYANNDWVMSIRNDDDELFKKCKETWINITESIGINKAVDFVRTNLDYDDNEFIMVDVHENTSFVDNSNKNKLVIVLDSVIGNYLKTSLVQHRY